MKHSPFYLLVAALLSFGGAVNAQAQQQQIPQAAPSNEPAASARKGGTAAGETSKPSSERLAQPPSAEGMAPGADKTPPTSADKPDGDKGTAEKR
jgi:cytoskeletal protein RodZ